MSAIQVAPSGERSQGRGRHGVVCRGNPVWSTPERLELKFHERRYTSTLYLYLPPVITKFSRRRTKSSPWFTSALRAFQTTLRRAEIVWKRTHTALSWSSFTSLRNRYNKLIITAKKEYYSNLVTSSSSNPRQLWHTFNKLLHRIMSASSVITPTYPYLSPLHLLHSQTNSLLLFTDKKSNIRLSLSALSTTASPHFPPPPATTPDFYTFRPATESQISKILSSCLNKQSDSDPMPTWLLKECSSVLIPTITNIVNLSLSSGQFHPLLKRAINHISPSQETHPGQRPAIQLLPDLQPFSSKIKIQSRLTDYILF